MFIFRDVKFRFSMLSIKVINENSYLKVYMYANFKIHLIVNILKFDLNFDLNLCYWNL